MNIRAYDASGNFKNYYNVDPNEDGEIDFTVFDDDELIMRSVDRIEIDDDGNII